MDSVHSGVLHFGPSYNMVENLLLGSPDLSTPMAWLTVVMMASLACLSILAKEKKNPLNDTIFIFLSILTIFIFRAPFLYAGPINPDEPLDAAALLNFLHDGKIWVSAEAGSHGPICYLLLAISHFVLSFFGIDDVTMFLVHFTNMAVLILTFFFLYKICLENISIRLSRCLAVFFIFYFSFNSYFDLQAYNAESVFTLFITISLFFLYKIAKSGKISFLVAAGIVSGCLPFVKWQAMPMLAVYIVWMLYTLWATGKKEEFSVKNFVKKSAYFLAALCLPTIMLAGYLASYDHGLSHAYFYYVVDLYNHVNNPILPDAFREQSDFVLSFFSNVSWMKLIFIPVFITLSLPIVLFILLFISRLWRDAIKIKWDRTGWLLCFSAVILLIVPYAIVKPNVPLHIQAIFILAIALTVFLSMAPFLREKITIVIGADWSLFFALLMLLSTVFAIVKPGTAFPHYLIFLSIPALIALMEFLRWLTRFICHDNGFQRRANILMPLVLMLYFCFLFSGAYQNVASYMAALPSYLAGSTHFADTCAYIAQNTSKEDSIVVWGWNPEVYVYSQRRSATTLVAIPYLVDKKYPAKNTELYVADIKRNRPKLIVDIVAPGSFAYTNADMFALEKYTKIWDAIRDDYHLVKVIPVGDGFHRIYAREN